MLPWVKILLYCYLPNGGFVFYVVNLHKINFIKKKVKFTVDILTILYYYINNCILIFL